MDRLVPAGLEDAARLDAVRDRWRLVTQLLDNNKSLLASTDNLKVYESVQSAMGRLPSFRHLLQNGTPERKQLPCI